MLTSQSKFILESMYCLQKMIEVGHYHNEIDDSLLLELGIIDLEEKAEDRDLFKKADLPTSNDFVDDMKDLKEIALANCERNKDAETAENSILTSSKKEDSALEITTDSKSCYCFYDDDYATYREIKADCTESNESEFGTKQRSNTLESIDSIKSIRENNNRNDKNEYVTDLAVYTNSNLTNTIPTTISEHTTINDNMNLNLSIKLIINSNSNLNTPLFASITNNNTNINKKDKDRNQFLESFSYDFVDSINNYPENYQNYVTKTLKSITKITKLDLSKEIEKRKVTLPYSNKKHVLLLDLDETLIHSDFDTFETKKNSNSSNANTYILNKAEKLRLSFFDTDVNEKVNFTVYLRPGVQSFLETLSSHFQIGIFTASIKEYADSVLNALDPENKIFSFRLYRDSCIKIGRAYVKDMRIFENKSLENLILLDNNMYSFCNQLSNGILISSFYDDPNDNELVNILGYFVEYLAKANDVKFVNDQVFQFNEIINKC